MVLCPPLALAALMSLIRSATVAALKVDGKLRSSRCSTKSRGQCRRAPMDRPRRLLLVRPCKRWRSSLNHITGSSPVEAQAHEKPKLFDGARGADAEGDHG